MIRHIVLFRATKPDDAQAVRDGLRNLQTIPTAFRLEVEFNGRMDPWSDEIDVVVYGEFEDEAALAAFKAHPIYEATIKIVKPLRDLRIAVDYQAPD
ncbi:MAG: Dabb family protein [Alphaproteobacteria bacterium]|jgi:quinol monooxygenase YgiN